MSDTPIVINDRRKFRIDGEPRPDAPRTESRDEAQQPTEPTASGPTPDNVVAFPATPSATDAPAEPAPPGAPESTDPADLAALPPPPSAAHQAEVKRAFDATVERIETAIRATNPGQPLAPAMTFSHLVQSLVQQAMLQMGLIVMYEGQQPRFDPVGARQTIDLITILAQKTTGNLTQNERTLIDTALFELRMGFLDQTQAMARHAATRPPLK